MTYYMIVNDDDGIFTIPICTSTQFLITLFYILFPCRYVLYKIPQLHGHKNKLISSGTAYAFITSNDSGDKWTLSSRSINSSYSIPGRTLTALYRSYTGPKARVWCYSYQNTL